MQYKPTAHELKMRKAAEARRKFLNAQYHSKTTISNYVAWLDEVRV